MPNALCYFYALLHVLVLLLSPSLLVLVVDATTENEMQNNIIISFYIVQYRNELLARNSYPFFHHARTFCYCQLNFGNRNSFMYLWCTLQYFYLLFPWFLLKICFVFLPFSLVARQIGELIRILFCGRFFRWNNLFSLKCEEKKLHFSIKSFIRMKIIIKPWRGQKKKFFFCQNNYKFTSCNMNCNLENDRRKHMEIRQKKTLLPRKD